MPSEKASLKCFARIRPSRPGETVKSGIQVAGEKLTTKIDGVDQSFSFDAIYPADVQTRQLCHDKCGQLISKVMEGFNVAVVAMGKTGAGKSYLMHGIEEEPGLIPNMNNMLFQAMSRITSKEFLVTISYLEVLDDDMVDLLNPHSSQMHIHTTSHTDVYVDGLSAIVVENSDQLNQLYEQGTRARRMGTNKARAHQEKASAILTLNVEQKEPGRNTVGLISRLVFADLAGIESSSCQPLLECIDSLAKKKSNISYSNSKLSRVLQEVFGGNSITAVFMVLSPNGPTNGSALQLSQVIRNVKQAVTINIDETDKIVSDLRDEISRVRDKIIKDSGNKESIARLQELVRDLQISKQQSWSEKRKLSLKYEEERKSNLANRGILEWVMDANQKGSQEIQERILHLQREKETLSNEYRIKKERVNDMKAQLQSQIAEYSKLSESGKGNDSDTKARVKAIHELKEKLKQATDAQKVTKISLQDVQDRLRREKEEAGSKTNATKGNAALAWAVEAEERHRFEAENQAMLTEEIERMKLDIEHEKAEIQMRLADKKTYTPQEGSELEIKLCELSHEKPVITLQIQSLKQEKERLEKALDELHKSHQTELEKQQMQQFQTFRNYREMFEKQKAVIEKRYRDLLDDAIQDAVFLSARNQELVSENEALKIEIAGMKDAISMSSK